MRGDSVQMTVFLGSGLAELVGYILIPVLGAMIGSAFTAALTTALTTLLVLSVLHGLGLGLAMGSHRLDVRGHWLVRPLLFSATFALLALASLSSNAMLIAAVIQNEDVSWWTLLAPTSAAMVQVASGVIVALWGIDRVARIVGDYASQVGIGDGERAGVWWPRVKIATRWSATGVWILAALALFGGSLLGAVVTLPLFAVAGHGAFTALCLHGVLMLVGLVAGGVLLVTRVAMLRKGRESSRAWSARIRGQPRESFLGKTWRVFVSLVGWLAGEAVLWVSCTAAVLFALSVVAAVLDPEIGVLTVLFGALVVPLAVGGLWLSRTGGVLRRLQPPPEAAAA